MQTVMLLPIADAGPNDGSASPPASHYQNLMQDPHDGDATFVTLGFAGFKTVVRLDVSAIPNGSTILAFRIRWAAKRGASLNVTGRAGIRIDDVYYMNTSAPLLADYTAIDEAVVHPDGQPWTKDRIVQALAVAELASIEDDQVLPRPRFTELVGFADIIPPPERPRAHAGRASHSGSPSSSAPRATLLRTTAVAGPSSSSPAARVRSTAPAAGPGSSAPRVTPPRGAVRAVTVKDLPSLRVIVSSTSPRARVSSSAPLSSVRGTPPKSEVE